MNRIKDFKTFEASNIKKTKWLITPEELKSSPYYKTLIDLGVQDRTTPTIWNNGNLSFVLESPGDAKYSYLEFGVYGHGALRLRLNRAIKPDTIARFRVAKTLKDWEERLKRVILEILERKIRPVEDWAKLVGGSFPEMAAAFYKSMRVVEFLAFYKNFSEEDKKKVQDLLGMSDEEILDGVDKLKRVNVIKDYF